MALDYENEKFWYLLQTVKGMEHACENNIKQRVISMNYKDYIFQTLVPEGKRQRTKKNGEVVEEPYTIYPGYIFIEMIVTDDTWFMIRNTPLVTGFLGSSGGRSKPVPVSKEEMIPILKSCGMKLEVNVDFKVGDTVKIVSGNFKEQEGIVDSMNMETQMVTVLIDFFGRQTPNELRFDEVKAIK